MLLLCEVYEENLVSHRYVIEIGPYRPPKRTPGALIAAPYTTFRELLHKKDMIVLKIGTCKKLDVERFLPGMYILFKKL